MFSLTTCETSVLSVSTTGASSTTETVVAPAAPTCSAKSIVTVRPTSTVTPLRLTVLNPAFETVSS
jgi:hypothetical protein